MKISTHCSPFIVFSFLSNLCILVFLSLSLLSLCVAHSYLTHPEPYTRRQCKACTSCPVEPRDVSELDHNSTHPRNVWRRGESINFRWTKNNHDGGFLRLSLVPLRWTFNSSAHKRFAFYYGCWEQGMYTCHGARDCGADKSNRAFRRTLKVPDVVPDGIYTLEFIWYGGIHFKRRRGMFSDFTSCTYVRIQGGPLRKSFEPFFKAGELGRFAHDEDGLHMCATSATETEECLTGCDYTKMFYAVPKSFQQGKKPDNITLQDYYGQKEREEEEEEDEMVIPPPKHENDTKEGGEEGVKDKGLCNYNNGICCDRKCDTCEQHGCTKRPGGRWYCCPWYIRNRSGRECSSEVGAPCYLTDPEKQRQQG